MPRSSKALLSILLSQKNPEKATHLLRFFKTGKGEYGGGDKFVGITMPALRRIIRDFRTVLLTDLETLLQSEWHEVRMAALLLMIWQYQHAQSTASEVCIAETYLANMHRINNWDLVDVTAPHIIGAYFFDREQTLLYDLAHSSDLWQKRIAIVSTLHFIRCDCFLPTLELSEILLSDTHDLMHKAVGWMLREIGKRDEACEIAFLDRYASQMARTTLRYAIERFPLDLRRHYLSFPRRR